jgi:hypothetical protein
MPTCLVACAHVALEVTGSTLTAYFTRIGDAPECILRSEIDLTQPEERWIAKRPPGLVLRPEGPWEGAKLPLQPSKAGISSGPENAVRDPAIWRGKDGTPIPPLHSRRRSWYRNFRAARTARLISSTSQVGPHSRKSRLNSSSQFRDNSRTASLRAASAGSQTG